MIDNYLYVLSDAFSPAVSHIKAIGQLVMEILHFKDLGDAASVVINAIILVLGGCQISMATYLMGGIYSHIKMHCNVLEIDDIMPL